MLKLNEPFRNLFTISFFNNSDLGLRVKIFFCSILLIFCPLDPDPGSQNLADLTDPDPKHLCKSSLPHFLNVQAYSVYKNCHIDQRLSISMFIGTPIFIRNERKMYFKLIH